LGENAKYFKYTGHATLEEDETFTPKFGGFVICGSFKLLMSDVDELERVWT